MKIIRIQSVVDVVTADLRHQIIRGVLTSGQRIKEVEIAREFNTSRPPVRESFKILESEGLITIRPRRGAFVSEITQKDIWEIYTVYAALTDLAIELAIEKVSTEDIGKLENCIKKMEEGVYQEPEDVDKYHKYHRIFHENILQIAENNRLMKICISLNNQTLKFSKIIFSNREYRMASFQKHKEILETIRGKNKDQAKRVSYDHVMEGMKNLQGIFEESKIEATDLRSHGH
jgi:DNA-binding GntR family transcriptional regulator